MKNSIFVISTIITAIIFLIIGFTIKQTPPATTLDKEAIANQTKEAIKQRMIEGHIINLEPEEIFAISGNVVDTGDNYLMVSPSIKQDPLGDIFPEKVKILTDENTKIEKWTLKTASEYEEEKDQNPDPYQKAIAQLNDIDVNYYIILAKSENNIKGLDEFTATEIGFFIENPLESKDNLQ